MGSPREEPQRGDRGQRLRLSPRWGSRVSSPFSGGLRPPAKVFRPFGPVSNLSAEQDWDGALIKVGRELW